VLRSTLIYAPAILLTRLSALLLLIVATRLISQDEYGLLTLVVTVGELTDVAVTNWLRTALLRLGGKGDVSRGSLLLAARVLVATTLFGLVVSVVASGVVVPERWQEFALAVSTYLIVGAIGRFALTVLQMQQRHFAYAMLESLRALLQLALPIGAILVLPGTFLVVSLSSSLAVLIAGIVAGYLAFGRTVAGPARFTQREFFALGVPLIVMALVGFGLNSTERVFLKVYYDAGAVALFAANYVLARQPIDMIANAINMGAFPELVNRFDADGPAAAGQYLSRLMALMLRLGLPMAALLIALGGDITGLVLPAEYHGHALELFPIIAFAVLGSNVTSFVYGSMLLAHKRPWLLIGPNTIGSMVAIGLSVLIIPPLAELGAALALAGGTLTTLATAAIISERLTPVPVPWKDIAISAGIAVATGVAAHFAGTALSDIWIVLRLAAGGCAGGLVFLALNSLVYPRATLQLANRLRQRLSFA
jgi:O-antigen/teichoic acid export membrane protein